MRTIDDVVRDFTVPDDVEGHVAYLDTFAMANRILKLEEVICKFYDLAERMGRSGSKMGIENRYEILRLIEENL